MSRAWASNQAGEYREYCPRLHDVTVKAVRESTVMQPTGSSHVAPVRQRAYPGSYQLFEEFFHFKHRISCEDVIGRPGDFVSHDGQGLCLSMFFLESGTVKFCLFISSQKEDNSLREGPLEMDVSDLCPGTSRFLPSRFLGWFYEPAIGGECLDFGESLDVVDLVEDGKTEDTSNSGDGAYPEVRVGVMLFGDGRYFLFELRKDRVIEIEKVQVELYAFLDAFIRKELCDSHSLGFPAYVIFDVGEVVLIGGVLDVSQKLGSLAGEIHSAPKEIACGTHLWRVDVGYREHTSSNEHGDFLGVYSVVLCFSTVDGFHVEGVTKNESNTFFLAEIGYPVPGEGALDSDDEIIPVLSDCFQEYLPVGFDVPMKENRTLVVEDAEVHGFCVQVDSTIILVLFRVEFHSVPPCVVVRDIHHTLGYGARRP
jgi:hypothetical protein